LDGVGFDGDPSFPFQIHIVQQLILLFPRAYRTGKIQQTIRKGAFAMVDMGYDAKISNVFHPRIFLYNGKDTYFECLLFSFLR
jgi:hypothetical protein